MNNALSMKNLNAFLQYCRCPKISMHFIIFPKILMHLQYSCIFQYCTTTLIPKAFEYFLKNLQSLQDFLKLLNIFQEFLQAIESSPGFRIFFQVFTNTPGLPEVTEHVSRISTSPNKSPRLQNIFWNVYKRSRTSWSC